MPITRDAQCNDPDVVQERRSHDAPHETRSGRAHFVTDRICDYIQRKVPAGQPFTSASMTGVSVRRDTVSHILKKLNEQGFFKRVASGVYVHDARFPVRREIVRSAPRSAPKQTQTRLGRIRTYIGEHISAGQIFQVSEIATAFPEYGDTVGASLAALKRSGYLVSAGYGRYRVWKGEQPVAGAQFLRPRLRAEVSSLPDASTFGPNDFRHLGNRQRVGNALETLEREGTITRVNPAQYVRASLLPAQNNTSFSAQVLQRIRELPSGQTFTRSSSMFEDLGTHDTLKSAFEYLLSCCQIVRVGWGVYVAADRERPQVPTVILTIKQQAARQIEARVPYHEKFTVEILDIPESRRALNDVLAQLSREGVIERVALGTYVRTSPNMRSSLDPL